MSNTTILNMIRNAFANAALSAPPSADEQQCIDTATTAKTTCESAFTDHTDVAQQTTHTQCLKTADDQLAACKAALAPTATTGKKTDLPTMRPELAISP